MTATFDGRQASGWADVAERPSPLFRESVDDRALGGSEVPVDSRETGELCDLEARLIATFSPPLRPEAVQRCLCDVIAHFDAARVRTYVAVLIERRAKDRLRAAAEDADRASTRLGITALKSGRPAARQVVASGEYC